MPDPTPLPNHPDWPLDVRMALADPMEEPDYQEPDVRWASDGLHDGHLEANKYAREHPEA